MKRTTLLVCTTALAAVALLSARPASAVPNGCESIPGVPTPQNCNAETVPEPGTILGTMLIGSAMVWKKYNQATKA